MRLILILCERGLIPFIGIRVCKYAIHFEAMHRIIANILRPMDVNRDQGRALWYINLSQSSPNYTKRSFVLLRRAHFLINLGFSLTDQVCLRRTDLQHHMLRHLFHTTPYQ